MVIGTFVFQIRNPYFCNLYHFYKLLMLINYYEILITKFSYQHCPYIFRAHYHEPIIVWHFGLIIIGTQSSITQKLLVQNDLIRQNFQKNYALNNLQWKRGVFNWKREVSISSRHSLSIIKNLNNLKIWTLLFR